MNPLNRVSLNLDGRREAKSNHGRFFGKDLTNVLQLNQASKQHDVRKRASSEYNQNQNKPPVKSEGSVVEQYRQEHLQTLFRQEENPSATSLIGITNKMRSILVDWLIDVHSSFNLLQRTLQLSYRFLDAYLVKSQTSRAQLQLVGITCLWIASKYEEIYPPRMRVFVDVTANTYSSQEMLDMEMKIMTALDFNLVKPTSINFIDMVDLSSQTRSMATYVSELATLEGLSLKYKQSTIALASISLGDSVFKTKHNLVGFSNKIEGPCVMECFKELLKLLSETNRYGLKALSRKYAQPLWHNVSKYRVEPIEKKLI